MSDNPGMPTQPQFEKIPSATTFENEYNGINGVLTQIVALAKEGKAGIALNEVIEKLMPFIENYNMEYTQGNIANGQVAASYALSITNYISNQYQAAASGTGVEQDAQSAIDAYQQFQDVITADFGSDNPFGTMGQSVEEQLQGVLTQEYQQGDAGTLKTNWKNSWNMSSYDSQGTGNATNSAIMQDINGAQNQAQSEAAYLQSEAKIANENYQQYAGVQHTVGQNIVSVENAATTAAQSAGN